MIDSRIRVLLVEHDPGAVRLVEKHLLNNLDVSVTLRTVQDLRSCLKRLREAADDIVLLDLGLPDSAGVETVEKIHAAAPRLPIVVLTEHYGDLEESRRALQLGAQDFLVKDQLDERLLARAMHYAIERQRLISALEQSKESLRQRQAKLDSIVRTAPVGIGAVADRVIVEVNERVCSMLGRSRDELVGQSTRIMYPSDEEFESVGERGYRQIKEKGFGAFEARLQRKDGYTFDALISGSPVDPDNPAAGITFAVVDTTPQKRAVEALRKSEAKFRTLFEQSRDAIYISTPAGAFIDFNQGMLDLLGYDRSELLDVNARDLYVEPERRDEFQRLIAERGFVKEFPVRLRRRGGGELDCLETTTAGRDPKGEVVSYQGIIRDVTERLLLEEQLRQAQKMEAIGQLAGGVAHDFNNLLTGINGYAQLVLGRLEPESVEEADLRLLLDLANRAADMTRQLLAFSRRQPLRPKVIDVNDLIGSTIKMLQRLIGERVEIEIELVDGSLYVRADPGQIEQVLFNLAINARDAMPQGGTLAIETGTVTFDAAYCAAHPGTTPGRYVEIAFTDTGIGIDENQLSRVFEPFFTTKEPGEGTGLGLSTVYGIVKQHGGNVWAYSEPGIGTTFKVYIPECTDEAEELVRQAREDPARHGNETILLVEDEEAVRVVAQRALEAHGYRVLVAGGPTEAQSLFDEHAAEIDLLLTDVVMPEMDGPTLYGALSGERNGLKVMYMSGYPEKSAARGWITESGAAFLNKPFGPSQLAYKVREALES